MLFSSEIAFLFLLPENETKINNNNTYKNRRIKHTAWHKAWSKLLLVLIINIYILLSYR